MRHEKVKVTRDTHTVHNLSVAPWEIPVLEHVFDEGNVVSTGEYVELDESRDYPDPVQEMARLTKAYGKDGPEGPPHAVLVYGGSRNGIKALAKAIDTARQEEAAAQPKRKGRRTATVRESDPLFA